jgi:hypothetical protein
MLKKLKMNKIAISESRERTDFATLFGEDAMTAIFQFIKTTEIARKRAEGMNECGSWDIDRLDHGNREIMRVGGGGRGERRGVGKMGK